MSAWIVSKRHIDLLVSVILRSEAMPEVGVDAEYATAYAALARLLGIPLVV